MKVVNLSDTNAIADLYQKAIDQKMTDVIILGWDADGGFNVFSSKMSAAQACYMTVLAQKSVIGD